MNCMKCGRDIESGQAFCTGCLEKMKEYPVNQDVPVRLPRRKIPTAIKKTPRYRVPSPEERIAALSRRLRAMTIALILTLILCGAMAFCTAHFIVNPPRRSGQNYSTITPPVTSNALTPTVPVSSPGK